MADRYWVGGSGTWNTTSTTNWSATSGGAGGASVPTAADNVIFNSATTYTVTMTGALACLNFTVSAGTVTFAQGTSPTLTISGNLSLVSATVWNMTGTTTFNATTSKTIGINNVNFAPVNFNGAAGTWTLTSAAQFRGITLTNGTFSTSASNYSLTCSNDTGITIAANSNNKTLSLNGSTVTVTIGGLCFDNNSTGNFTFNAGTSTFSLATFTSPSIKIFYTTQNLTFYNVSWSSIGITDVTFRIASDNLVYTFNNITASLVSSNLIIPAGGSTTNMVINGTLTFGHTTFNNDNRALITSQDSYDDFNRLHSGFTTGDKTQGKISAAAVNLTDVDFYCVNNTGLSAWTGTRLGDFGNNTNITTSTPRNVYYSSATLGSWYANSWSNTSGGGAVLRNYPLPQDTAIIDNNSGTGTLQLANTRLGTIDLSSRTTSMNLRFGSTIIVGNYIASSSINHLRSGTSQLTFGGLANSNFNVSNFISNTSIKIAKANSNVNFNGNVTTNGSVTLTYGNLNINSNLTCQDGFGLTQGNLTLSNSTTLTANGFDTQSGSVYVWSQPRSINFGSGGKIVIPSDVGKVYPGTFNGHWWQWDTTNFSYTGIPNVFFTMTGSTAPNIQTAQAGITGNNLVDFYFTGGTYTLDLLGQNFGGLDFTGSSATLTGTAAGSVNFNVYGFFKLSSSVNIPSIPIGITFKGANGKTNIISFNGKTWPGTSRHVIFDGETGTSWKISDSVTFNKNLDHINGKIDLNANTLTCSGYQTYTGAKNLTFNGGTLSCNGSFNNDKPGGFTVTQGTGTGKISMISGPSKSFIGGSNNYSGIVLSQAGEGTLTVSGSNSFEDITNDYKDIGATTISFTSGTTQTVNNFTANGSIGKLLSIRSTTAGSQAILSKSSDTVYVEYLNLKDNRATGGAIWRADNSTNQGNVSGWYPWISSFLAFF